jgi:hypothetical protein
MSATSGTTQASHRTSFNASSTMHERHAEQKKEPRPIRRSAVPIGDWNDTVLT